MWHMPKFNMLEASLISCRAKLTSFCVDASIKCLPFPPNGSLFNIASLTTQTTTARSYFCVDENLYNNELKQNAETKQKLGQYYLPTLRNSTLLYSYIFTS